MGVLCNMASGPRLLRSVGHGNAEDVSHGRKTSLQVELGGLGEVGLCVCVCVCVCMCVWVGGGGGG